MKGKCKTVHSAEKKKKNGERREAAVEEEGSLSDGSGQLHQLVGIPDCQSPCLGFKQEMRWRSLAPVKQQMPSSEAFYFLRVPLAEMAPHLGVNVSYSVPKKLRNLGERKNLRKSQENRKKDALKGFDMFLSE